MKITIRPRLNAEMVDEARRLGLNLSRIVDEALTREIEAERLRRQVDRGGDREGGDGTGSSTTAT
jgi:post-segregation antitoxin (ccd killing protein)